MIDIFRRLLRRDAKPEETPKPGEADSPLTAEERAAVRAATCNALRRTFLKRAGRPGG